MSLFATLAQCLATSPAHLLAGDASDRLDERTPAAVLMAVVDRAEPGLILTVRTATLRHHAGQIAFPGGRIESGETAEQAALREADEEIGLAPSLVRIVGTADLYSTVTGFAITPVLGVVPPDLSLVARDGEVAEWFEVPLAFVTDPANQMRKTVEWQGGPRSYWEIEWAGRRIWGATAGMIANLSRRLELAS